MNKNTYQHCTTERTWCRKPSAEDESSSADGKIEENARDETGRVCRRGQRAEYVQGGVDKDNGGEDSWKPGELLSQYRGDCKREEERPDEAVEQNETSRADGRANRSSGPRRKAFASPPLFGEMKEIADGEEEEPPRFGRCHW